MSNNLIDPPGKLPHWIRWAVVEVAIVGVAVLLGAAMVAFIGHRSANGPTQITVPW